MVLTRYEAEKIAKEVFSLNEKIRFAAFTCENELIFNSMRKDVKSYAPNEVDEQMGEITIPIASGIFEKFKEYYGEVEYLLIRFKKINLFVIPFSKGLFTMSTEGDYPIENLIEVKKVLSKIA
ncbi:hypothetical protein KEJ50_01320 [Candidatus Bathyarchaeota archaeon]|nr:hypothetical protein [Candidatus Bathyarchaeota archaeon]